MIKRVLMFTVCCDVCGTSADDDTEWSCWTDETTARETAHENDFMLIDGKDVCPLCYHVNDDNEYAITTERQSVAALMLGTRRADTENIVLGTLNCFRDHRITFADAVRQLTDVLHSPTAST